MQRVVIGVIAGLAGAFQLFAAYRVATAKGALQTQQARQLESALGRRGTVAFFAAIGLGLVAFGAWIATR